jgi:hypothetical protein
MNRLATAVGLLVFGLVVPARAQQAPAPDVNELAKQTQNPVANLVSVPLQFNFNSGGDLEARSALNLNFQPVMPFALNKNVNVIARTIVPINSFPVGSFARVSGVGDIQEQVFFTPAKSGSLVWAVGPAFSFPTATELAAETGTWGLGVTGVVVKTTGKWVLGSLLSQIWPASDAGGDPKLNIFTLQPFVNYNFGHGWAASFSPIITANLEGDDGDQWTLPLGAGITKTTVFNKRPMNVGVQYYYNAERPDGSAGQQLRFTIALLFPTAPGGK